MGEDRRATLRALAFVAALWGALFAMRAMGPPDLEDNDQSLVAAYSNDVVVNGSWLVQREVLGHVATKPPLYQWIVGVISLPFGRATELTLVLPSALATLAQAALLVFAGRWMFGSVRLGAIAATLFLCTPITIKAVHYARTDPLFSLCLLVAALGAHLAWTRGRGWGLFWGACVVGAMVKTPAVVAFALCGLLAVAWERGRGGPALVRDARRFWIPQALGLAAVIVTLGGWFLAARGAGGDEVAAQLVDRELLTHVTAADRGEPFNGFWRTPAYFVNRMLPWSPLAVFTLVWIALRPDGDDRARRSERFLFCVTVGTLFLLCFATMPRGDHVMPLVPFVCLLAARPLDRVLAPLPSAARSALACVAGALALAGGWWHHHRARADDPSVVTTVAMRDWADRIAPSLGGDVRVVSSGAPYSLQFFLGTMEQDVTLEEARAALESGDAGVVVFAMADRASAESMGAMAPLLGAGDLLGTTEWGGEGWRRILFTLRPMRKGGAEIDAAP